MGTFARKVTEAYAALSRREIVVPEWDLTLFVTPITVRQYAEITETDGSVEKFLTTLRVRAKNDAGGAAFDDEDIAKLRTHGTAAYGVEVLARVTMEIMADVTGSEFTNEAVDIAEKK